MLAVSALARPEGLKYSLQDVQKIMKAITKIQGETKIAGRQPFRKIEGTENELNSYIAYRIEKGKDDIMKDLRFKLYENNRIEGWILIDLSGHRIPIFLKTKMNLYFAGVLVVQNSSVRLDFQSFFIDGQQVPLMLLNLIVNLAAKLGKSDAASIFAWNALPYGIKDIRTKAGQFSVYY